MGNKPICLNNMQLSIMWTYSAQNNDAHGEVSARASKINLNLCARINPQLKPVRVIKEFNFNATLLISDNINLHGKNYKKIYASVYFWTIQWAMTIDWLLRWNKAQEQHLRFSELGGS